MCDYQDFCSYLSQLTYSLFVDKQVFPSLEFIGWYSVASVPTARHIALHEQVRPSHCYFFLRVYIRS